MILQIISLVVALVITITFIVYVLLEFKIVHKPEIIFMDYVIVLIVILPWIAFYYTCNQPC